jgi:hypothetical protein
VLQELCATPHVCDHRPTAETANILKERGVGCQKRIALRQGRWKRRNKSTLLEVSVQAPDGGGKIHLAWRAWWWRTSLQRLSCDLAQLSNAAAPQRTIDVASAADESSHGRTSVAVPEKPLGETIDNRAQDR